MGRVALAVGIAVAALTIGSQAGLLGAHDFVLVAFAGLASTFFCLIVSLETQSRGAAWGAALSVLPFLLLAYFVLVGSD